MYFLSNLYRTVKFKSKEQQKKKITNQHQDPRAKLKVGKLKLIKKFHKNPPTPSGELLRNGKEWRQSEESKMTFLFLREENTHNTSI